MSLRGFTKALVVAGFSVFSSMASADLIGTFTGGRPPPNDCSGVFGQGFENCEIPFEFDENQSPIIIKFDYNQTTGLFTTEISGLFPTIDGNEFSFDFTGEGATGTWTYNPGAGDPAINFFVAKGGPGFNLFSNLGDLLTDDWSTPDNPGGNPAGLSHLSFYDTGGGGQVPEPTTLLLLGAGLFAAGFARRRVKRD
jgi:PEP-CTERM motif